MLVGNSKSLLTKGLQDIKFYKTSSKMYKSDLPCGSITQLLIKNGDTAKIGAAKKVKP